MAVIEGGPGDDWISGSDGADRIDAGPGRDSVQSWGGDDDVRVADGEADKFAHCDEGTDSILVDTFDPEPFSGCETVTVE